MNGAGLRNKGHAGERELCAWLTENLGLKEPLTRNIEQVRDGGGDIMLLPPFSIEVKRQEALQINKWWNQAKRQRTKSNPVAVLAYRKNRHPWQFMMSLDDLVKKRYQTGQDLPITMGPELFLAIVKRIRGL